MKEKLLGKSLDELKDIVALLGLPKFTANQVAQWLYSKKVDSIEEMTNLSKTARARLSEDYEIGKLSYTQVEASVDGTKKYLFPVKADSAIEAVMIPDNDRRTLCVSSQSGCKLACKFCMTGRQGFHGHLSTADIISQFLAIDECSQLTNTVFMGMGEPLDNYKNVIKAIEILTAPWGFAWSPKRITVSTIGVLPFLRKFLDETRCHLALSLHNPFSDERLAFMPIEKVYPVKDVVDLISEYDFSGQRRVSFEYTMFSGFNDSKRHADALARMLKGIECRVNLIRFHKIPDFQYEPTPIKVMESFRDRLNRAGLVSTIRTSRGEDILAACGMLAGQNNNKCDSHAPNK